MWDTVDRMLSALVSEDPTGEPSPHTRVNVVLVILCCVVLISVLFEAAKEKLYEHMEHELREVAEVLFGGECREESLTLPSWLGCSC